MPHAPRRTSGPGESAVRSGNADTRAGTEERGSFTFGTCHGCGWTGPGRRARAVAARDAAGHLEAGCPGRLTAVDAQVGSVP
jgi:hypothetical protein